LVAEINSKNKHFEKSNSSYVFNEVKKMLDSGESRSLWRRIESEMYSGGVGAVETYLRSSFEELVQQIKESANRFTESLAE